MQNTNINDMNNKGEEFSFNIRDLLVLVLKKWYWFALSVIVCLSVAVFHLMSTPKIYERKASILVKDARTNPTESALFQDLALFEGTNNVNNEAIILKSIKIMSETVRRLKLDVSYTVKDRLRTMDLYMNSPVAFTFIDAEDTHWVSLKAKLLHDNEVAIWDFMHKDGEFKDVRIAKLNDTIDTPAGRIVATPTLWYDESWFGNTITVRKSNYKSVVNGYRGALNVIVESKITAVINLSIRDVSVQRAEDVLNTVIDIYNEEAINDKNLMAIKTENFIDERLIIIEKELGIVEDSIKIYKTGNLLTDIRSEAQIALQESSEYDKRIIAYQNQHTMAVYMRKYLSDPTNSSELIPSGTGVEDMHIEGQINSYNQLLLKRNQMIEGSSERNVRVQQINGDLISMRQNIVRAVDNLIINIEIQLRSANARNERSKARISAIPQQQSDVQGISRQQQIKEQIFVFLLSKREDNALNKAITESTARIIDSANGSSAPVAPRRSMIMMAAFLIGLFIPAAVIYFLIVSDITVHNRKDLISVLSIPFLGEVPYKKMKGADKKNENRVVVKESGRDPVSEAFRLLRTNMDFMRVKQDIKVITTTSTNVGSGKTFISSNFAVSLAMTGKKVLLIDMDIRKGSLGKNIEQNNIINGQEIGLTSYLSKIVDDVDSLIINDKNYPNVDIIRSGPEPPNPAELLLSSRLDDLIAELKNMYDYIVIDSVPAGMIADALITNRVADLTLYIVRAGKMDRRMLPDIEQLYREEKLKNMAIILNGVGVGMDYSYKYGYGYGYGYGYNTGK